MVSSCHLYASHRCCCNQKTRTPHSLCHPSSLSSNGSLLKITFSHNRLAQEPSTNFLSGMTSAHPRSRTTSITPRYIISHRLLSLPLIHPCSTQALNLDVPLANNGALGDLTFESLNALLSSTNENGVYNLENINPADLVAHPQGELEIAMAPQPDAQSLDLGCLFNDFDFGAEFAATTQEIESGVVNPLDTIVPFNDFSSLFQAPNNPELQAYEAAQQRQRQPSAFTREILDFINFEGGPQNAPAPQVRPPPPPPAQSTQVPIFTQMTNTPAVAHSGYIPPSGAANSSTRRVAASWKPSFAVHDDLPVDQTQWNVPIAQ